MTYKTIYTEVDVDLTDFDTDDLIEELESRGAWAANKTLGNGNEILEAIWLKRRNGNDNYQTELDQLIYQVLGHVV
jgi:hypothetical protein